MDRSFLSQPEVVAAARPFVCIRLATYENALEAKLLRSLAPTGSGELENTVFAILSSDGKRPLARASRSARHTFGDADRMALGLNQIARRYAQAATTPEPLRELPTVANVRLAVDVAACDGQPLVVVLGQDAAARRGLSQRLAPLAWNDEFRGRFVYVEALARDDLTPIGRVPSNAGLLVVQPDRFGLDGAVITQTPAGASSEALAQCLRKGLALYQRPVETFQSHVREGHEQSVFWQTAIPVTDPMERRAREHGQRR
jgi:hypothetical protein